MGETALMMAADYDRYDIAKALISNSAELDLQDISGEILLQ